MSPHFQRRASSDSAEPQPADSQPPAAAPASPHSGSGPALDADGKPRLDSKGQPMSKALAAYIDRREQLDSISIREVARVMGCVEFHDNDPTKWKMPNGSNFWFKPDTEGWKDLNNDQGGQGAVKLVRWVMGFEKEREVLDWLSEHFTKDGKLREGVTVVAGTYKPPEEKLFRAPANYEQYTDEVLDYLVGERGIPPSLVRAEIKAGRLYATRRDVARDKTVLAQAEEAAEEAMIAAFDPAAPEGSASAVDVPAGLGPIEAPVVAAPAEGEKKSPGQWGNRNRDAEDWKTHCAFISRTAGELRCVEKDGFKGTVPGSQSDSSGYSVPHQKKIAERIIAQVEAAVDAQSYSALFPGRYTISTNGAYRFTLHFRTALETLSRPGFANRLAFDADAAGDLAAQRVFNAFYASKAIAHHYKLEVSDVEEWFLSGQLKVDPDNSPHTLFFGSDSGYAEKFPVHARVIDKWTDDDGKPHIKTRWEPTEEMSAPLVVVRISQPVGPFEKSGQVLRFKVSPKMYDYVVNDLDVRRDRPKHSKDWNEELLRLGVSYVREYERCAANGFEEVPKLPPDMEIMRSRAPLPVNYHRENPTEAPASQASAPTASRLEPTPVTEAVQAVQGSRPRFQRTTASQGPTSSPAQEAPVRGPERRFRRPG